MNGRSTIFRALRFDWIHSLTLPLALAAFGCSQDGPVQPVATGGSNMGVSGAPTMTTGGGSSGGAQVAGGSSSGGASGSSGGPSGTAGAPPVVTPVACQGPFPTEDVSGAAAKVSAGASTLGALPHFWNTFGLGRLGLYLNSSQLPSAFQAQDKTNHDGIKWSDALKAQTVDAVQNLKLNSIRAHGLFHDDIGIYHEDSSGTPSYDFTRSDIIFDFFKANHIAPIVELASMPHDLAADPSQTVFDWKMITSPPKDYDKWQALVQAFVQHSVDRYGADLVNTWYFEVWNEPECCSNKFWKGSLDDYFKLYDKSAAGVRAVLPNGRMGGPVSSQAVELTSNSMAGIQFLDHIKNTSAPLGFFSFHTWDYLNGAVNGYFSGLDLLDSYNQNSVQIAVTEFGPTWEFGLMGGADEPAWEPQETTQGAAFVAQIYSNIAQRCAKDNRRFPITYAWWTLSDVFDEGYSDPNDYSAEQNPFIGAMGLMSRESIKKPAYNAYKFLAGMGDQQLSLTVDGAAGIGGMAAHNSQDGGIQVLLYNGQSPGAGYTDDTYYTVAGAQNIGITVQSMNPTLAYDVNLYRVDDVRGNAWAVWDKGGRKSMANMSDSDWQAVKGAMESPAEPVGQALCGATFSKTFSLSSPGVLLLSIQPSVSK